MAVRFCVKEGGILGGNTLNWAREAPFLATARSTTIWPGRFAAISVFRSQSASN
jgi:hypothetical protein